MPLMGSFRYLSDAGQWYWVRMRVDFADRLLNAPEQQNHPKLPDNIEPRTITWRYTEPNNSPPHSGAQVVPREYFEIVIMETPQSYAAHIGGSLMVAGRMWHAVSGDVEIVTP